MKKLESKKIKIETDSGLVSAILDLPSQAVGALTLAHGAGAGMQHAFMGDLASALAFHGLAVLRFQFPYMEAGQRRTDHPSVACATVAAAVCALQTELPQIPLFAAGKSFGARMTTSAAADGLLSNIKGIICYGFPLHPSGSPDTKRATHLSKIQVPKLFFQGTRDKLADPQLMGEVCAKLPRVALHWVEGADHGFDVLKKSGRTPEDVREELARESIKFVTSCSY